MPKTAPHKSTKSPFLRTTRNPSLLSAQIAARHHPNGTLSNHVRRRDPTRRVAQRAPRPRRLARRLGASPPRAPDEISSRPPNPNPVFPNRRRAMASRHRGL